MIRIAKPDPGEHNPYYSKYIALVTEGEDALFDALERQPGELRALSARVTAVRQQYRYAPDKWSVRQVFGHLTDVERVFGYRAFRIGRGDKTPLSGFDENAYVAHSAYDHVELSELVAEFADVRRGNLAMLRRLTPEQLAQVGTANDSPISVRALAYIMGGHVRHHVQGLAERYGLK